MRYAVFATLCVAGAMTLAGCEAPPKVDADRALEGINVIDESNLNDIMLTAADPNEAVTYFKEASREQPDRIDLKRGLAKSLTRAKRPTEAVVVWAEVAASGAVTADDRIGYAGALIRTGDWDRAEAELDRIPPTYETYDRYRLEAMVADSNREWERADSYYETAAGLTTRPAGVLNNWGYSKLTREDFAAAEDLFARAITYDSGLFTAKNNLVLARAAQGNYTLPIVPMTQPEKAQLLHTLALSAIRRGDVDTGRRLLRDALDTHPQHFEAAARSLEALDAGRYN